MQSSQSARDSALLIVAIAVGAAARKEFDRKACAESRRVEFTLLR